MNLFLWLSQFGLTGELFGERLVPIGTVYDPFIARGLDALIYALYVKSRFVLVGTPSGVTLAPEGGAHQSTVTPSLGIELPGLRGYEPAFAREVVWTLLEGIRGCLDRTTGSPPTCGSRPARSTSRSPRPSRRASASTAGATPSSPAATGCIEAARGARNRCRRAARSSRSSRRARSCPRRSRRSAPSTARRSPRT